MKVYLLDFLNVFLGEVIGISWMVGENDSDVVVEFGCMFVDSSSVVNIEMEKERMIEKIIIWDKFDIILSNLKNSYYSSLSLFNKNLLTQNLVGRSDVSPFGFSLAVHSETLLLFTFSLLLRYIIDPDVIISYTFSFFLLFFINTITFINKIMWRIFYMLFIFRYLFY
jgi:hypothetical protein